MFQSESQNFHELMHRASLCKRCYRCVAVCPVGAITVGADGIEIDRDVCTVCGDCVEACPHDAMRITGKDMTVDEVFDVVKRDIDFYEDSGGGVTLSGGEVLLQPEFALALLRRFGSGPVYLRGYGCRDIEGPSGSFPCRPFLFRHRTWTPRSTVPGRTFQWRSS